MTDARERRQDRLESVVAGLIAGFATGAAVAILLLDWLAS